MSRLVEDTVTILICEDDHNLGVLLADYLHKMKYRADLCFDGEEGISKFRQNRYDLCLLDINMPEKNGFDMLKEIREMGSEVPVIFLTGRSSTEDILLAYDLGCDEYLIKPCPMDILTCKIRAIMRRCALRKKNTEVVFDLGGMRFDSVRQQLGNVHLSARESDLLLILCRNMNETVDRSVILRSIWSADTYFASRSLSVYINHLRNHLEGSDMQILSVHGKGYKIIRKEANSTTNNK